MVIYGGLTEVAREDMFMCGEDTESGREICNWACVRALYVTRRHQELTTICL